VPAARPATGVHAIVGADSFLAEKALSSLLASTVGAGDDVVQVFRGEESSWVRVIEAARTGSLFVSRRAVVVRGAENLKGEGEEVGPYLDDPSPEVTLVLMAAKADKRRQIWKRLLERAAVTSAEPLKGRALRGYVVEEVRRRRLALSEAGQEELLERVGQDLRRLMGELDKLESFALGRKEPLSGEEVAALLGRGLARPLYRIGDAFAERRRSETLALVDEAIEEGEVALRILATLHRALRQTRGARALQQTRASREDVISRLGLLPFKVGDVLEAARRWTDAELKTAFAAVERADRRMKTGLDGRLVLAAAISEALAGARRPER
jgi:DNA polymerase III subunit delta